MINFFKKQEVNTKTTNEIIEEIHESFYTEVDKLLKSAKILNSLDTDKNDLIEKHKRLKALGFNKATEVLEAEKEIDRLNQLSKENEQKEEIREAINYFSFKYPNYKFITEESVRKICQKYNLIYGAIDRYLGSVPDKNLKHIEDFKIDQEDECFFYEEKYFGMFGYRTLTKKFIDFKEHEEINQLKACKNEIDGTFIYKNNTMEINEKSPLEIAAPIKDFDTTDMEVKDFQLSKIEIPDPVVLKPVLFNMKKYYLIITAWGQEALDSDVVNERFN